LWQLFAYCARYGGQPLSELKNMTLDDLATFANEISAVVQSEHPEQEM
jgi:hypothetical protein